MSRRGHGSTGGGHTQSPSAPPQQHPTSSQQHPTPPQPTVPPQGSHQPPAANPGGQNGQSGQSGGHDPNGQNANPPGGNGTPHPARPADDPAPAPDNNGGGDGGDGAADPREGWFAGFARQTGESVSGAAADKAGEWISGKVFGSPEGEGGAPEGGGAGGPGGEGTGMGVGGALGSVAGGIGAGAAGSATGPYPAGGEIGTMGPYPVGGGPLGTGFPSQPGGPIGTVGPYPVGGRPTVGTMLPSSAAYAWTRAQPPAPMTPLPEAQHADRGGLGGMLDEAVVWALEKSGLMKMLEKVTGNLAELNAAADEWQVQAKAVLNVAEALRSGAQSLPGQWEGDASDAFGQHMGEVVEALDSTAEGMAQTAEIISKCAQECAMAEGMVVEIISEAIEVLIASLAAEAVIAVFTAGIGLIADALITEGEIAIYVARVARVSTELATKLEKLLMELKKLGSAVKAVRSLETAKTAVNAFKEVKVAAQGIREFEEGGDGLLKAGREAFQSGNFDALKDAALRTAVGKADNYVTGKAEDALGSALGIDDVQRADDLSAGGLAKGAGRGAWGAAKEGLTSDTNVDAVKEAVAHGLGMETEPEPYRVDPARIQQAFG